MPVCVTMVSTARKGRAASSACAEAQAWVAGRAPAQAVVLIALVVALGLVDALVGLLLVAPAAVVGDLGPGVAVPCRVPAQPAESLHRECSGL